MIFIGADHRGFEIKENIKKYFIEHNIFFEDCGDKIYNEDDDYPDIAFLVGQNVIKDSSNYGILICYTGEGMCIAANKVRGVRAALSTDINSVKLSREHNNANILILNSENPFTNIIEMIELFLNTPFSTDERHHRRVQKILDYENSN